MNLIPSVLCDDEGVTQARGCQRHETDRGVERWHCTICCLEFCAGYKDTKRQHLSTDNTNSDFVFYDDTAANISQITVHGSVRRHSLTALLTKRAQVRFCEVVNTCAERRAEKCIQRTVWILNHLLCKTLCGHVNGLCPAGWLNAQSITNHWFQSVRTCLHSWATFRNSSVTLIRNRFLI